MSKWTNLDLKLDAGYSVHINNDFISRYKDELLTFLEDKDYMHTINFAKNMMMSQEIKSNNTIEGINNDLSVIDEVIEKVKVPLSSTEKSRIINMYHGYQYILTHKDINKESLRDLYRILSNGILDDYSFKSTGEYYRTQPVYLNKRNNICIEPYKGINEDKIDNYMNHLFEYVNDDRNDEKGIDAFIKSQIMHFYFVYIHPYMDVNGRTSRTMSMWYLLNKKSYPYIIFNRAIAFSQSDYETYLINAREYGNLTLFLRYMLQNVHKELEKEYVINNIESNLSGGLTKEEHQMIEYFLETKSCLTVKDVSTVYNTYNEKKKILDILNEKILPLVGKGIIEVKGNTSGYISSNQHNMWLGLNPSVIDVDKSKIKHLNLDRFTK